MIGGLPSRSGSLCRAEPGQGITHSVLTGLLTKNLIASGSSPWEAIGTYISET